MGAGTADPRGPANPAPMAPMAPQQGLGALQNAYSQFMTQPPAQPNPMFGAQPTQQAQQVSNVLDSYMGAAQQPQMAPAPAPAAPPPMPASTAPTAQAQQPLYQQLRPEDPRMQAMRGLQRTGDMRHNPYVRNV